jgi:coenzyme F420-reducing hydrogenase beta subunit
MEGREGWNTLIVRTDIGMKIVDEAIKGHWLESENLPVENFGHLKMAALNKRERGNKARADMYGNGAQE